MRAAVDRRRHRPGRRFLIVAALVIAALIAGFALRGSSPVGHWTSGAAKDHYTAAYAEAMELMPEPQRVLDVRTDFGLVRVYRFAGASDDRAPLVLLPGTASGAPVWAANLPDLLQIRSVYALDLLGEPGMSIQDRPITSAADQARWLDQVLHSLPEPRFQLVGLSIGGWTATNLALHHPDRVAGLILVEPVRTFADFRPQVIIRSIPASVRWLPTSWRTASAVGRPAVLRSRMSGRHG